MAAVPPEVVDNARKSTERKHNPTSHGRGGAGNFGSSANDNVDPTSLETPTIKSQYYTTGRGGQGNIAKNDDPEEARRAQDVTAAPRQEPELQSQHIGRGGGGNVFRPSKEDAGHAKTKNTEGASADGAEHADGNGKHKSGLAGLVEKGKELLSGKK